MTEVDESLDLLYFKLFDDCNAKCNMCECWLAPFARRDVSYYLNRLAEIATLRPRSVRFTGGEPLLLKDISLLVRRAADTGARVSVITNGRLLRVRAAALADAGCAEVIVSLDGTGATHDQIRDTPGLFDRCVDGITAVSRTTMTYGVNTVVQRAGIDDLPTLANLLSRLPRPPAWWHLIPVRDHADLLPTKVQQERLPDMLRAIREQARSVGVTVVADDGMFEGGVPSRCTVPTYAAYYSADTGAMYGCNMLAYSEGAIGNVRDAPPATIWTGSPANELRRRCTDGMNADCARCDGGSRQLNHLLRDLAVRYSDPSSTSAGVAAGRRDESREM